MAYKYNGKLTGDKDPWQQPGAFAEDPNARPNVPHIPNINWDNEHRQWVVRSRKGGKNIHLGTFAADKYEDAIAAREAALGPAPTPRPRNMERPNKPEVTGIGWSKQYRVWVARFRAGGKRIHVGSFAPEDYDKAVKALRDAKAEYFPNGQVTQLKPCGTHAAYQRHVNRGEPIDTACRRAEYEYVESHRRKKVA